MLPGPHKLEWNLKSLNIAFTTGSLRVVHLRCSVTASLSGAELAQDLALLDGDESAAACRLRLPEDRRDYTAAHALLRRMLTAASPEVPPKSWLFDRPRGGKPRLRSGVGDDPPLRFSLSHTQGLVVCAVSAAFEVGVDAERDSPTLDVDEVRATVCSAGELAQLDRVFNWTRASRFLDLWTLKEAYVKARGIGITDALTAVSFDLRVKGAITASVPAGGTESWWFAMLKPSADTRVSLAVARAPETGAVLDSATIEPDGSLTALDPVRTSI